MTSCFRTYVPSGRRRYIGCPQYAAVKELVDTVAQVAGKKIDIKWVDGPVGVQSRNFSNDRIYSTGWRARYSLKDGIALNYPWVEQQVMRSKARQTK